jgi:hypothetical protein
MVETTERLSLRLTRRIKLEDALVDQLMEIRQLAWMARSFAGDASGSMSNALEGLPLPPNALAAYSASESKVDATWAVLENLAAGLPLPARFTEAVERAKREYFARDYHDARFKMLQALVAGDRSGIDINSFPGGGADPAFSRVPRANCQLMHLASFNHGQLEVPIKRRSWDWTPCWVGHTEQRSC